MISLAVENEDTKGLHYFTVHVVDSRLHMCSSWKSIQKDGAAKTNISVFNETFVKQRKLGIDPRVSI